MKLQEQLGKKIRKTFNKECGNHPEEETCDKCERLTTMITNVVITSLSGKDIEEIPLKSTRYQFEDCNMDHLNPITIEFRGQQRLGESLPGWKPGEREHWAIVRGSLVFNKQNEWEHEPVPGSRIEAFYARTRFSSAAEAFRFIMRVVLKDRRI